MFDEDLCRLCLKSSPITMKIFTANITHIIETLTSIKVKENDGLPSVSCKSCISDLYTAHEIRNRIIESDKLLKSQTVLPSTRKIIVDSHDKNNANSNQEKEDTTAEANEHQPKIETHEIFIKEEQNEGNENAHDSAEVDDNLIFDILDDDDSIYDLIESESSQEKPDSHKPSSSESPEKANGNGEITQPGSTKTDSSLVTAKDYEILTFESDIIKKDTSCRPPKYSCKICNITLEPGSMLFLHRKKHVKAKCKICDVITRKDNIRKHVMLHKRGPQICYICGSWHKSIEGFRTHLFYYHRKRKNYKCEECGEEFHINSMLWDHRRRVHTGDRRYQCDQCGKAFFTSETLKRHYRLVHLGLRDHPCDFCSKRFSTRNALKTHRRQHTGELPYACEVCTAGFRQRVSLRTHMKSKHNIIVKTNKSGHTHASQSKRMAKMQSEN